MAPPGKAKKRQSSEPSPLRTLWKSVQPFLSVDFVKKCFLSPSHTWILGSLLLTFEALATIFVINRVPYTEIDWKAYMQEVEGVVNGTWDYHELKGDTGPLVYPAGFVYFFLGLYHVTDAGTNVRLAQYIFAVFYLLTVFLVVRLYNRSYKVPPYMLIFVCCTSYRIHSVFILRLFNDPVATMFLYVALNCFMDQRWRLGSFFFSLAVSIKMNVLLFAPALLMVYLICLGFRETVVNLIICAALQVVLALPFVTTNPAAYLTRAFDFGRVFLFQWTVNWRFLPEEVFVARWFHFLLLLGHLLTLALFAAVIWHRMLKSYSMLLVGNQVPYACQLMFLPLFSANLIGVAFARSLHYQFYVWYYHSLPYLLWCTPYTTLCKLLIFGVIEMCWNTYPSTSASSAVLHVCHLLLLAGIWWNRPPPVTDVAKIGFGDLDPCASSEKELKKLVSFRETEMNDSNEPGSARLKEKAASKKKR